MSSQQPSASATPKPATHLSARSLEAAVALANLPVWALDADTWEVHLNEAATTLLGMAQPSTLPFDTFLNHFSVTDTPQLKQELLLLLQHGKNRLSFRSHHYQFDCQPVATESGNNACISGTIQELRNQAVIQPLGERRFRGSEVGIFRICLADDSIEYSPALSRILTGREDKGLTRQDFVQHIHPEDAPLRLKAYENALKTGDLYYEGRTIWHDGSVHWIRTAGSYSFDEEGQPLIFIGTVQDTSEEKARDLELHETERRFRNMIHQAPMGIALLMGREMVVEIGNEKIFELWGKENSMLGCTILEVLPEIREQGFLELLQNVYETGQPYFGIATQVELYRNGQLERCFFDFTYTPIRDHSGKVHGVMVLANEVTAQVLARKKLEESEQRFITLIEEAPFATALYKGPELIIDIANNAMIRLWGKDESVIGKKLAEALPELEGQPFLDFLAKVYTTGTSHHEQEAKAELVVNGQLSTFYFNYTYKPMMDEQGRVYAILNMATDVTEQVMARIKLEESELFARSIIYNSPVAKMVLTGPELVVSMANENLLDILGRDTGIIGQSLTETVPELAEIVGTRLRLVMRTGKTISTTEEEFKINRQGRPQTGYYNTILKPLATAEGKNYGVIFTVLDVTSQVLARRKLEESELFAHSIIYNSPVAKVVLRGPTHIISIANENLLRVFNKDNTVLNQPLQQALPELWRNLQDRLPKVLQTGSTFATEEEAYRISSAHGTETRYFNSICKALPSSGGGYYGVIVTIVDVTEQVRNRQRMAEAKEALRGAIELAELGTWEMDLQQRVLYYSDRLAEWSGTIPGIPIPEAESLNPVHPEDRERVKQQVAAASMAGARTGFNSEYRLVHPVTGEERIIHAQGITYFDLKGAPLKMTGTARDVTKDRQVQASLELEVKKRTAELNLLNRQLTDAVSELAAANEQLKRSNEDLAQYAHVASHDLQEPLRKIRMFSGMLKDQDGATAGNESLVNKINQSAERMSLLIKDLLDYSRLLKTEDLKKPVDLNEVLQEVLVDFELKINEINAKVTIENLPVIDAVPLQMNQLFFNLIGNALKFSVSERPPFIQIACQQLSGHESSVFLPKAEAGEKYYHITVSDNGIGFEDKYAQQIFEVFKRLHGREVYPGSGIGLALCRRIVDNHQGYIYATSEPDHGTTFHLILPQRQRTAPANKQLS